MSLSIIDAEFKKKIQQNNGTGSNSVFEHAGKQLLYTHVPVPLLDEKGKPVLDEKGELIWTEKLDIIGRTELPNPSGTALLVSYEEWYEKAFPFRKDKCILTTTNNIFMEAMVSKDRKGRIEFTQVETASALNSTNIDSNIQSQVSKT